ncbi:hypothetical protein V8F20_012124 [Naviculisporaceae sp. PSN 640]
MPEKVSGPKPNNGGGGVKSGDTPDRPDIHNHDPGAEDVDGEVEVDHDSASGDTGPLRPPPRKRRRTVISCIECHRRKQKCDRKLPCGNCISRHKQHSCEYESGAPTAREQQKRRAAEEGATAFTTKNGLSDDENQWQEPSAGTNGSISSRPVDFGYSQTGASTLGFLQKLEDPQSPLSHLNPDNIRHGDHFNTRERYKTLIRQLPARTYIDKLVDIYFIEFNWQYQGLDRDVFDKQLQAWYTLPFHVLTTGGPQALEPNLRAFPALLFQVLSLALLLLHSGSDPVFESLKYAGNMSFEDLAMDYSESGMSILSLLGKRQMTITNVYTGFLRACFLKYVALVTESWHAIGSAIRDGQEIGLHRDSLNPKPANDTPQAILGNQWEIQRRRKLWMTLVWWDIHTAVVLGRPASIDHSQEQQPILPIDAKMNILPAPSSPSSSSLPVPLVPRTESDPPTPLTRLLFAIRLGNQLRTILHLESRLGSNPHSYSLIDNLHNEFLSIESQIPAWLRLENPDTQFDALPQCYWIPYARAQLPQLLAFNIMALHRPYIFTRLTSRTEAVKASLGMLQAQRYHFASLNPAQYKMFSLFFGTFDAIVLVAAVYILFPQENRSMVNIAVRHFAWAAERFRAMSGRNGLARAALGVLKAVEVRFLRSVGLPPDSVSGVLGKAGEREKVPLLKTRAGLMPLPWADGDGPALEYESFGSGSVPGAGPSPLSLSSVSPGTDGISNYPTTTGTNNSLSVDSIIASNGPSPVSFSSNGTGSASLASSHPNETARDSSRSWSYNTTSTPSTFAAAGETNLGLDLGASDWNISLPSNFDWSSLQPIFATNDLLYNDLQLHASAGFGSGWGVGSSGGGNNLGDGLGGDVDTINADSSRTTAMGQSQTGTTTEAHMGGDINMMNSSHDGERNSGQVSQGGAGTNNNGWLFEGDFGSDSFWGLLNQYGPPGPQS